MNAKLILAIVDVELLALSFSFIISQYYVSLNIDK